MNHTLDKWVWLLTLIFFSSAIIFWSRIIIFCKSRNNWRLTRQFRVAAPSFQFSEMWVKEWLDRVLRSDETSTLATGIDEICGESCLQLWGKRIWVTFEGMLSFPFSKWTENDFSNEASMNKLENMGCCPAAIFLKM